MYSSGAVVTGDGIADAVIEYAQELAKLETSDTVDIPVLLADGSLHEAQLLLGPASQLVALDDSPGNAFGDQRESAVIEELREKIRALRPRALPVDDVDLTAADPYEN
jgi:hypothetical protein